MKVGRHAVGIHRGRNFRILSAHGFRTTMSLVSLSPRT
jgi:hypothetical protein